jgi:spore germination cell wall hydrolase CwlJ-like protein
LFCLAKNIYHEAGAEPIKGRYAVAQVTLNRAQDRRFAGSVCEVVFAPHQFSWANTRSRRWATPTGPNWQESKRIALDVLEKGKRLKGMEQALYFHSVHINPRWRNVGRLTRIGGHIFYTRNG